MIKRIESTLGFRPPRGWQAAAGLALALSATNAGAQEPTLPKPDSTEDGAAANAASSAAQQAPVVTPPSLLHFVEAPYPPDAEQAGLTGEVVLRLRVEADGSVSEADVISPAGHGFDEAAVDAARAFTFSPAVVDGKPVAVRIPFKYSFTLQSREAVDDQPPPTLGELRGQVRIAGAELPLAGAAIRVESLAGLQASTETGADGTWALPGLTAGEYEVIVEAKGFIAVRLKETVAAGEITDLTYRMSADIGDAIVVSVFGERPPREVVRRTISRREMTKVPGTSGDALRGVQNLPGLARPPGLAGLLIVRGSAPEDTATFVEGDQVPFIYHFGGLSSAIPTELLESIDFYPGNFSARYGRVMGGIVDVKLRSPGTECTDDYAKPNGEVGCFHGLAQVDLIDTRALVQGPLPMDGWTFAVGGRRSWVDAWLRPALREAGTSVTTAPVYHDYQVIVEAPPSPNSRASFRFFGSDDALELLLENPSSQDPGALGGNLRFATSFFRVQALVEAQLSNSVRLTSLSTVGKDNVEFSLGRFRFDIESYPVQARNEFEWNAGSGVTLYAGLDFQIIPYDILVRLPEPPRPGESAPGPFSSRPLLENTVQSTFFRPAWYLDSQIKLGRRLTLAPGVRVDYARDTGHGDFSPRMTVRYDLTRNDDGQDDNPSRRTTLKGGAGFFHQPATPQETDEVFGTPGLSSNRALHYSLGVERELTDQIEVGVEGFYKDLQNLVSRSAGATGTFNYQNEGSGSVVGAEVLLKYKADERFFGWLAYTLSRSVRQDSPDSEQYPFQFDQTHIMTVLGSYKLGRGWEVGARLRIISGPLDTPARSGSGLPAVFAADAATYTPLQAAPFSERLPLVHQLDLRMEKAWQFRSMRLTFFVDLWNAYNNPPREGINYNFNFSQRNFQQGLPLIPSLGLKGEF